MSYWIEIRCGYQWAVGCYSKRQVLTPMEMTATAREDHVKDTLASLTKQARASGWTKTKQYGWVCPPCQAIKP